MHQAGGVQVFRLNGHSDYRMPLLRFNKMQAEQFVEAYVEVLLFGIETCHQRSSRKYEEPKAAGLWFSRFILSDMMTSTITVATYGIMSSSCVEMATAWPAMTMFWHLNASPLSAPNAHAAKIALSGFHVQKITSAIEIQPAPAVMFSCQRGTNTRERYAPPSPQTNPPAMI